MKIAIWHNLPSGGGKRALYDQVKGLVARGHTVEAWCPPTADTKYLPLSDLVTEHVVPLHIDAARFTTLRRKVLGRLQINDLVHAMQKHSAECARQMAGANCDLLLANSCRFFAAPMIGRFVEIPKVLYLQEPKRSLYEASAVSALPWAARLAGPRRKFPKNLWSLLRDLRSTQDLRIQAREEWLNVKAFDAVLVNSLFSRESMRRTYGINARLCSLGVDTSLFAPVLGLPKEDFIVGLGALDRHKNAGFVLEAIARIPAPRPRLVWVGNVSSSVYLEELTAQAQASGVDFEPQINVSTAQLLSLLSRAVAMAYAPILEPFGYAPLEANACGLPVVAVAEGGVRETIVDGGNGLLVDSDPAEMARAIECLRQNPERALEMGRQARTHVEAHWQVEQAVERLERELSAVLKNAAVPPRVH